MDKQRTINRSLMALFATFGVDADADLIRGYVLGIGDLSTEQIQDSVLRAIRECERLPRPAELRKLAGESSDPESLAIAAWGDVLRAVPLGPWKHVSFQDVVINASIRLMGGWPTFLERFSDADSEKWLRQEFIKAYRSLSGRVSDGEVYLPLPGLSEKQIRNGELVDPVPVRIGCRGDATRIAATNRAIGIEFSKP